LIGLKMVGTDTWGKKVRQKKPAVTLARVKSREQRFHT